MPKYNVNDKLNLWTAQAEDATASEMLSEFSQLMLRRFKEIKDDIEDWQNLTGGEKTSLVNRLRGRINGPNTEIQDYIDMAIFTALLWNEEVNGE